ncbi:MAG: hypothetical protein J5902_04110 [Paludibacteraceae bacterium]|nr:hypothetical protein [Paludibacteraceae bacterium]
METENKTLIEQPYIACKSSFFGLFHHLVYTPTNSRISDYSRYYGHVVRDEMQDLFSLDDDQFVQRLSKLTTYEEAVNGNVLVEGHVSADKQFVSLRLYLYEQIDYQPVSKTYFLQGETAQQAVRVFKL